MSKTIPMVTINCHECKKTFETNLWSHEARKQVGQDKFFCNRACFHTNNRKRGNKFTIGAKKKP